MSHTSYNKLQEKIKEASKKVKVGGMYHHWKDPNTHYKVIEIGFTEWDENIVVIYQDVNSNITWIRRLKGEDGWLEPVNTESSDKRRFVEVSSR